MVELDIVVVMEREVVVVVAFSCGSVKIVFS